MIFTFHFNKSLNVEKFAKHASHYISHYFDREITYHLYINKYKLACQILANENPTNERQIKFEILEVERNDEGHIVGGKTIMPLVNNTFKDISYITQYYQSDRYGMLSANSTDYILEFIYNITKILNKIEKLSAFI